MKLAFNSLMSGLANNGGTRTILKCCKTLNKLGHQCDILARSDRFTWFKHRKPLPYVPDDLDVIIAVACSDAAMTAGKKDKCKKAWYIRAHENWAMSDFDLSNIYRVPNMLNIVNSKGLKRKLKQDYKAGSKVVYQGIDFDWWEDRDLRPKNKIRIGALHTKQPRKRWKDFVKLAKILGTEDYEYVGMGSASPKNANFLTDFKENANVEELNNLYSSCHVWFAPTDSEGLHNVPMEAALCGCLIVCADEPLNGMIYDYAFEHTAMIYRRKDIEHAAHCIKHPDWSLISNMQDYLRYEIGTREENMKKMVDILGEL